MITNLRIRQANLQFHRDITEDMFKKKNGLFSFVLRVHDGDIKDYVIMESKKYDAWKDK